MIVLQMPALPTHKNVPFHTHVYGMCMGMDMDMSTDLDLDLGMGMGMGTDWLGLEMTIGWDMDMGIGMDENEHGHGYGQGHWHGHGHSNAPDLSTPHGEYTPNQKTALLKGTKQHRWGDKWWCKLEPLNPLACEFDELQADGE